MGEGALPKREDYAVPRWMQRDIVRRDQRFRNHASSITTDSTQILRTVLARCHGTNGRDELSHPRLS